MRPRPVTATLVLLLAAAACTDKPPTINVTQLERGGDVDRICLCSTDSGGVEGAPLSACEADGDPSCKLYVLLMQRNRGEIAVVDITVRQLEDTDRRAPFVTFPQVGVFPSEMVVSADGASVWVAHMGEPTLAELPTSGLLGPTIPEATFHDLPGKANGIALDDTDSVAYATLPDRHALAVVDLAQDPPAVTSVTLQADPPSGEDEAEGDMDASSDPAVDAMDAADSTDAPDGLDAPPDVPGDVPADGDGEVAELPPAFTPVSVEHVAALGERGRIFVSGFDGSGGGGVLEMDAGALEEAAGDPLVRVHLPGTPVGEIEVVEVEPVEGAGLGAPEGFFLYAADRDETLLHVVDLQTGREVDSTTDPLVKGGAIRTDGLVVDLLAVSLEEDEGVPEGLTVDDLSSLDWNGVFVFALTSTGVMHAVDVYDRSCWTVAESGGDVECTPHVLRNALPQADAAPYVEPPPTITSAAGDDSRELSRCFTGYPCLEDLDDVQGDERTYGVTFYPDVPGAEDPPAEVRRPRSEIWSLVWEGSLLYSHGAGGNLSEDGAVLTDPTLPFCGIGVRGATAGYEGDVLVIEDGPSPLSETADCSAYPPEGGAAYRIVSATQDRLRVEPTAQWSVDSQDDVWLTPGDPENTAYPLPTEECFPFAVRYHVRTSKLWTVTGSRTGFLHSTALDEEGRCVDDRPACGSWEEHEEGECTLRSGRARMDEVFVNPYIRFEITSRLESGSIDWGEDGDEPHANMKPGLTMHLFANSGFTPMSEWICDLPDSMVWVGHPNLERFYVSDRGYDGLIEFDPDSFSAVYTYQ
jgi:hypothetical protein